MDYLLLALAVLADVDPPSSRSTQMADQTRKDQTRDLPPKTVPKSDADKVKGGAEPVNRPKPVEPINDFR